MVASDATHEEPTEDAPSGDAPGHASALPALDDGTAAVDDPHSSTAADFSDDPDARHVLSDHSDDFTAPEITPDDPDNLIGERPCPTCDGAGHIPYGIKQSSRYAACDECGGIGQILTGSLLAETAVLGCEKCNGTGFMSVSSRDSVGIFPVASSLAPSEPPWPGAIWNTETGAWVSGNTAAV